MARLNRERDRVSVEALRDMAVRLAASEGFVDGLFALSLVRCAASSPSGWADERDRDVLRALRRHAHPDVRALALSHFTKAE